MTSVRISKKIPPTFSLDVEFTLGPGITALCGPAEAGKSLILETIAGFSRPDSGRLIVEDAIVYDAATRVFLPPNHRRCAYVPQRCALFPYVTLRRNLQFAAQASPRLERMRRINETAERFGISAALNSHSCELSPDLRRRGEVARALLAEPRLLLLDDRGFDEPLLAAIREAFEGPTLLVTGDFDAACASASRMILLDGGRIAQTGASRALVDHPESVEAARLLGYANVFEGTIAALDPGRNSSRLEFEGFALSSLYIPGHFRGDRVWVAARAESLRVHPGDVERPPNAIPTTLVRATPHARAMRLEFSGGIFVDAPHEEYERRKDNKSWLVEFPPQSLRVL
jgi:molybdate transport system ATP-binding protein